MCSLTIFIKIRGFSGAFYDQNVQRILDFYINLKTVLEYFVTSRFIGPGNWKRQALFEHNDIRETLLENKRVEERKERRLTLQLKYVNGERTKTSILHSKEVLRLNLLHVTACHQWSFGLVFYCI